jgi:tyrosyl-tRNA synthetase
MKLIEELQWRGMLQDIMPGTEAQLEKEMTTGYIGFDPTSDSLHIGSLVPIMLLLHLQKAGHKPLALLGGATGMVGDPSGKSEERNLLSEETLNKNLAGVKKQLEKFLDFDPSRPNAAEIVNNYDWFKNFTFLDFIRDVGKHITVNYMMSKDSVKKRLEGEQGMSFTEFTYQLVQGYDFYYLCKHHNCKLQMGGSDQWGNIVTGTELIRRKDAGEAFAFTCPLMTKADGGKFGKTEKGNIWLDPEKTSPYQFFQFWLNATDLDAVRYIKTFTFLSREAIDEIIATHETNKDLKTLQKRLAKEITVFVHGEAEYTKAIEASQILFSAGTADVFRNMNEKELLEIMDGVPLQEFPLATIEAGIDIVSFLADAQIFPSKGEARKMVQGGGVSINKEKLNDTAFTINPLLLLNDKYILVQKGKKQYFLVKAV